MKAKESDIGRKCYLQQGSVPALQVQGSKTCHLVNWTSPGTIKRIDNNGFYVVDLGKGEKGDLVKISPRSIMKVE